MHCAKELTLEQPSYSQRCCAELVSMAELFTDEEPRKTK